MRFLQSGNCIECLRPKRGGEELVATFDGHLQSPPPHVEAVLRPAELQELRTWLKDRKEIHSADHELLVLETAADIMERACAHLEGNTEVPMEYLKRLKIATLKLFIALRLSADEANENGEPIGDKLEHMSDNQRLKLQLKKLSKDL